MRWMVVLLLLISQVVIADFIPHVQLLHKPPSGFTVSYFVHSSVGLFGGEHGQIFVYTFDVSGGQWTALRLEGAGLMTGITVPEKVSKKMSESAGAGQHRMQNRRQNNVAVPVYAVSSNGGIYQSHLNALEVSWSQVYFSGVEFPVPLFDIAHLDQRRLLAVGAFGTVLESINKGETWRPIGDHLDNVDSAHFYKIVPVPRVQAVEYGIDAFILGEFGRIFMFQNAKQHKNKRWRALSLGLGSLGTGITLFDGAFLSEFWAFFFGVDGVVIAFDFRTGKVFEGELCSKISVFSVISDNTSRNVLLAGDQDTVMRLSMLDEGQSVPPALTCSALVLDKVGLHGLAMTGHQVFIFGQKGVQVDHFASLISKFSKPVDIQWVR